MKTHVLFHIFFIKVHNDSHFIFWWQEGISDSFYLKLSGKMQSINKWTFSRMVDEERRC